MGAGEATSLEGLPSFVRVQASVDLRYEVNSLMEVRTSGSSIKMSQAEVRDLIEANGGFVGADEEVSGIEGDSVFLALFPDEVPDEEVSGIEVPDEAS